MNIILWIIFGAIAGWIASMIMKTGSRQGIIMDVIYGVLGAFLGGWIATLLGGQPVTGFNLYSIVVAILGAVLVIGAVNIVQRRV
jgi:uncharacterized membrane protein YeaQ/YmgE (transglycosylase-associated protein family)